MARTALTVTVISLAMTMPSLAVERPNILFCFSLNDVINTQALDAIGRSGVVFNNAFVSAPGCTPCRASVVTGMPFYRCGTNAFLRCREYGKARDPYKSLPGFSELLSKSGYHVMHWGKTTNKHAGRRDFTHKDPICHCS